MSYIIGEFSERVVLWANVRVERRTSWIGLGVEPITVVV
jgi:hypothetical protein